MVFTRAGGFAFHWARRARVLARDILRLGTAMVISSSLWPGPVSASAAVISCVFLGADVGIGVLCQPRERGPPGVCRLFVLVPRFVKQSHTALWAQAGAVFLTNGLERQC